MEGAAAGPHSAPPPSAAVRAGWRPVVTAFVQRGDGRVLVVRRSSQVSTYQGMWGGVSGGVEASDTSLADRAFAEIEEEVGVPRAHLRPVFCGRPLPVRDQGRRFLVHPFLMAVAGDIDPCTPRSSPVGGGGSPEEVGVDALAPGAGPPVALNWENTEARWVLPAELPLLPHVPLLQETLRRVVLPQHMQAHVDHLEQDRAHGAAELAAYTVQAFGAVAAHELRASEEDRAELSAQQPCWQAASEAYRDFAWRMACARPSMVAIANASAAVMASLHSELKDRADGSSSDEQAVRLALLEAVRAESAHLAARSAALRGHVEALVSANGPRAVVLTTSFSSTLLAALTAPTARGALGGVIVCEARPLCEGVAFARALAAAGVPGITIITDAQAAAFVKRSADLVLLGADALGPQGAVNKVGSLAIALAAREARVPVYACADSGKVGGPVTALVSLGGSSEQEQQQCFEENGPGEVIEGWGRLQQGCCEGGSVPGVAVRNVYFEAVPLALLTGVVTEVGLLMAREAEAAVTAREQSLIDAFGLSALNHPPPADE